MDKSKEDIERDSLDAIQNIKDEQFEIESHYYESKIEWAINSGHLGCERKHRILLKDLEVEYFGKSITPFKEVNVPKKWKWNKGNP